MPFCSFSILRLSGVRLYCNSVILCSYAYVLNVCTSYGLSQIRASSYCYILRARCINCVVLIVLLLVLLQHHNLGDIYNDLRMCRRFRVSRSMYV